MLIAVLVLLVFSLAATRPSREHVERSMDWHRRNGRYRVLYPDGQKSQPFGFSTAKDYAEIHGGKVIPR